MKKQKCARFIEVCQEVADAYGITLQQYFDVTLNSNIIDHKKDVDFKVIYKWQDNYEYMDMHNEEQTNED